MSDLLGIDYEIDPFGDPLAGLLDLDVAAPAVMSSLPVYTLELEGLTLAVIRVDHGTGRESYQTYAVDDSQWAMVAMAGLYVDALLQARAFRRYLAQGGSLGAWIAANPDGVRPDVTGVIR